MKKIIFTIFTFMLCSIGFIKAQALDTIPNHNFKHWNGAGQAKECPQGWDTLGGVSYPLTDVEYETMSTSANPQIIDQYAWEGSPFCLSLASQAHGNNVSIGAIECKFKVKHQDPYIITNMAYFEAGGPQSASFDVIMWNSKTHDTVCNTGFLTLPGWTSQSDTFKPWSTLNIPLTFTYRNNNLLPSSSDTTTPDSCHLYVFNVYPFNLQGIGSFATPQLYIETMQFANAAATVAAIDNNHGSQSACTAYPNPFTNKTSIHYNLTSEGEVNLSVYDMQGKEIRTIVNGNQLPGLYNQTFDGSGLNNGVYMYRLQTSSGVQTGKLILNK